MEFKDKVIIISGSSSGIGKKLYDDFKVEGARSIGFDINEDADYLVDVRDYKMIKDAIEDVIKKYQRIDVVINCAGGNSSRVLNENKPFNELSIEAINWGVDVNLRGPIYMARATINQMIKQESGVIVNIGSVSGVTGSSTAIDYSASKSGLEGLTKSLALLGAPHKVRCVMISPGPVLTRPDMANMPTALNRAADTSEICDLIKYLCSDKASFITGSNYIIDGGRSLGGRKHEQK